MTQEEIDIMKDLIMARAPQKPKRKSATDLINNLIDQRVQAEIEKMMKAQISSRNNILSGITTSTYTTRSSGTQNVAIGNQSKAVGRRGLEAKQAYQGTIHNPYGSWADNDNVKEYFNQKKGDAKSAVKIVDETTNLEMKDFTPKTHAVLVSMRTNGSYIEEIESKVVGKQTVEWWEYVMLYGFYKAFKIALSLDKYKAIIGKPVATKNTKNKEGFIAYFKAKNNGDFQKLPDRIKDEVVYRLIGKKYVDDQILFDIPYKETTKKLEYVKENLIFEDNINTLEPDLDAFLPIIQKSFDERQVPENFRTEILKNIYGRLRGF